MVLQQLNEEIMRRNRIGESGLPPVQPLTSVNGLEMFGFLSSPIIQVNSSLFSAVFTSKIKTKTTAFVAKNGNCVRGHESLQNHEFF